MERMRNILRGSLGKALHTLDDEDRLSMAWPVAVGGGVAAHSRVAGYEGGCVTVRVDTKEWKMQLEAMTGKVVGDLKRISGVRLTEIRFEVG